MHTDPATTPAPDRLRMDHEAEYALNIVPELVAAIRALKDENRELRAVIARWTCPRNREMVGISTFTIDGRRHRILVTPDPHGGTEIIEV